MTDHEAVQESAAELALGLLSGPERAEALAHLESCATCRTTVEELSDVADRLLLLAPETEPPAGFETAVLARAEGASHPRRRPRRAVLVAAAVALVVGAIGGALVMRDQVGTDLDREYVAALEELDGRALAAATIEDGGRRVGQLFLYQGAVSWLFATVDDPGTAGELTIELRFEDGRRIRVAGLHVVDGRGSLGATVAGLRLRDLDGVAVVDGTGATRYLVERVRSSD